MWLQLFRSVQRLTMSCIFSPVCFARVRGFRLLEHIHFLVALDNVHISFSDITHNVVSFHPGAQTYCHDVFTDISVP